MTCKRYELTVDSDAIHRIQINILELCFTDKEWGFALFVNEHACFIEKDVKRRMEGARDVVMVKLSKKDMQTAKKLAAAELASKKAYPILKELLYDRHANDKK